MYYSTTFSNIHNIIIIQSLFVPFVKGMPYPPHMVTVITQRRDIKIRLVVLLLLLLHNTKQTDNLKAHLAHANKDFSPVPFIFVFIFPSALKCLWSLAKQTHMVPWDAKILVWDSTCRLVTMRLDQQNKILRK